MCVRVNAWTLMLALLSCSPAFAQPDAQDEPPLRQLSPEQPAPRPATFAAASAATAVPFAPAVREERRFIKEAMASNRFEADASRLALARSTDPRVISFATALLKHHATAGNELIRLLHVRGMAPPMQDSGRRRTLNRLGKLSGAQFDHLYRDEIALRATREDVRSYERAALAAQDPALKAWIERALPAMRENLTAAERVAGVSRRVVVNVSSSR